MNWIILRGLVREKRHWGSFPQMLEEGLGNGSKVVALDLPGFGTEVDRASPAEISKIVGDLRARFVKEHQKDSSEWGILAVSLGGMCALSWISKYPNDFKKVVLINSSVNQLSPLFKRMIPRNFPTILKIASTLDLPKREKTILKMTTNLRGEALDRLAIEQAEFSKTASPSRKNAIAQIVAAIRFRPPAPERIKTQLLVMSGLGDTLVDPSCSAEIAKYYAAKHVIHPTGNHDLAADEPQWIIEQVKNWANS